MQKKEWIDDFKTNPGKAAGKVSINSFMMGNLFFILTLIWTLSPEKFSSVLILQLVLAIPLLFVSSLAYAKVAYWQETKLWDRLGWITNHFGSVFILNVVGLIAATFSRDLAFIYFGLSLFLMFVYSLINVIYKPSALGEKIIKFLLFVAVMFVGGVLPLMN